MASLAAAAPKPIKALFAEAEALLRKVKDGADAEDATTCVQLLDDAWAAARAVANSDVDGIDLPASPELVTPELVQYLHENGKRVAVWVWRAPAVNDTPAVWDALSKAGVDAFTSNLPPSLVL